MDRVQTYVDNQLVLPAELNDIQDKAWGVADHNTYATGVTAAFSGITEFRTGFNGFWNKRPFLWAPADTTDRITIAGNCMVNISGSFHQLVGSITLISGTGPMLTLAANTRYYLYACAGSGLIIWDISTSYRDSADPAFKAGGGYDRVYAGTFVTNGSAEVVPFCTINGKTTYRWSRLSGIDNVLANVTAPTGGYIDLFSLTPVGYPLLPGITPLVVDLMVEITGGVSGGYGQFGPHEEHCNLAFFASANTTLWVPISIPFYSNATLGYVTTGTAIITRAYVTGFQEP